MLRSFTALPTWQAILVATTGAMALFTSLYLLRHGYVVPIGLVLVVALLLFLAIYRIQASSASKPPSVDDGTGGSQFTVFRDMEPADQTRVNPFMGILQEDVYANRTGPIGVFAGNDDASPRAPLYPFTS